MESKINVPNLLSDASQNITQRLVWHTALKDQAGIAQGKEPAKELCTTLQREKKKRPLRALLPSLKKRKRPLQILMLPLRMPALPLTDMTNEAK